MPDGPVRTVITCNYRVPARVAARGAKAYLVSPNPGSGHERVEVLVRSRGGRWLTKWEPLSRLWRFRVKHLPPEHPLYDSGTYHLWDYAPGAEPLAEKLKELTSA